MILYDINILKSYTIFEDRWFKTEGKKYISRHQTLIKRFLKF